MASIKKLLLFITFLIFPLSFALFTSAQELVTNGGFESGNSNGWSVSPDSSNEEACSYYIYSGKKTPLDNSIEIPPVGNFAASSDTLEPPCTSAISQEIAVPAGAKVSCSLIYYYENFGEDFVNGPGLNSSDNTSPNQKARIDIMSENSNTFGTGAGVLKNLFQTQPGDPLILDYTTLNFSLTEYAGTTVIIRAAQANNQGDILFAIDAVSCTVEDLIGGEETSSAPFAYVTNIDSDNVSVINVATKEKIGTVDVGKRPEAIAASVDGKFIYVANSGPNTVSVIEVSSNKVVDTINVNNNPLGIAASPDGDFVYVTNSGSKNVSIIDTSSNDVVGTVSLGDFPLGIAFTPDGKFAYVVVNENNVVAVIEVSSMEVVKTIKDVGTLPMYIAIDPAGNFAYVSDNISAAITIIDLSTNEVSGSISLASVNDCCQGTCLQVTPDSSALYVAYASKVVAIDLSTNQVVKTINTNGNGEAQCLAITPDGEFVYVSNYDPTAMTPDPPISIIEVSSNTVVDESIVAGDEPYAIAMTPEVDSETPDSGGNGSGSGSCSLAQAGPTNYSFMFFFVAIGLFIAVRITRKRSDSL